MWITEHGPEIITAVTAIIVTGIPACLAWYKIQHQQYVQDQMRNEMRLQAQALDFPKFIEEWGAIATDLEALMRDTPIDRFLVLRAWNGILQPVWTTAIYQMRMGDQEPIQYVHFELDHDYVGRLREISANSSMCFRVQDIPQSFIKDVYEAEGVLSSIWWHLNSSQVAGTTGKAVTYCSFSSGDTENLDAITQVKCRLIANRLQGIAHVLPDKAT